MGAGGAGAGATCGCLPREVEELSEALDSWLGRLTL